MYEEKAKEIVKLLETKGDAYAKPDSFFVQLSHVWSGLLGVKLTPSQCCAMMMAFKACRVINKPDHQDTADDLVGYSLIMTELINLTEEDGSWINPLREGN